MSLEAAVTTVGSFWATSRAKLGPGDDRQMLRRNLRQGFLQHAGHRQVCFVFYALGSRGNDGLFGNMGGHFKRGLPHNMRRYHHQHQILAGYNIIKIIARASDWRIV